MSLCPRCAGVSPPGARFCPACGTPLIAVPDTRFASPDTYTPPHLAARILGSRSALAGERKEVTVLFADMKGSMELFADRDPEEASRILEETLGLMLEAVHRYEGTVNQVMGDGIMALFGAPLAREDHAVRACYAALRMQERVTAYGDALQREQALPVQIRVGLNSGEVVVRSIGSDLHMAYTAVGQTVNLAARMEQMAKPASILATGATIALAGPRVVTRPLGPIPVRGLSEPVEVHELVGAARLRSRLEGLDPRAMMPLVGREAELERLLDALAAVRAGRGQVVSLVGEAGVGKSRLLREVTRLGRSEGWLVLEVAGVSFGRAMGYSAGVEMHRQYFEVEDSDAPGTIRDKVTRKLSALDPALEDGVPAILWRLGALPPGSAFLALDAATRRRRADEMSLRIIESEARRRPAIVVVEDLQWIDAATLDSLTVFVRRVPPATLVLVTHRPDVEAPIPPSPVHVQIRLEPLRAAGARELLDGLLGADPALEDVKHLLIERAGGNPLFLEECVRSLVGAGTLEGERGAYRLRRSVVSVEAPAGVRSVLAARIDRLPPDQKWLLQAASVIGDEVPVRLLEAIADAPAEEVRRALGELRSVELLDESALFPELEYRFTHSLTHDVAYESLLHDHRRAVHERIVDAIERVEADRLVERTERLAHHAFLGEVWDRAVTYCRAAGARALARLSSREAVAWFERALAALGHWPDGPEARALAVDLRHELHGALVPQGDHARMLAVLGEAEALAEALGDERRLARALSLRGTTLWELGRSRQALEVGARGLAIAERTGALDLQAVGNYSMGGAARAVGDYPRAVTLLRRNQVLLQGEHAHETFGLAGLASVLSLGHLVWSLAELGEFVEAIPLAEGAIRLAQKADHAFSLAHAHLGLGGALLRRGQIWEASTVLERGIALCADVPTLFPPMAGDLSVVSALSGRVERAVQLGEQGVARAEAMGRMGRLSLIVTHLGETCVIAGRPKEATRHAERALDLAIQGGERGNQVYALRLLGVIAAEQDPPDADGATDRFGRALALAEDLGMRPLAARCHLGLGRLARRIGDTGAAATHLGRAAEMLAEMGMTFWLERMTLDHVGPAHS